MTAPDIVILALLALDGGLTAWGFRHGHRKYVHKRKPRTIVKER